MKIVSTKFARHALREIRLLELLAPHAHIAVLVEAFGDPLHYYIVMEMYHGGELLQRIRKMVQFTERQAAEIMRQLVAAIAHIHSKGVVHRDLKPEVRALSRDLSEDSCDFNYGEISEHSLRERDAR